MKLKEYQEHAMQEVKTYLEQLALWRGKMFVDGEWLGDFSEKAWEKAEVGRSYVKRKDGAGRPLPTFCLKIPTGGGKTLLAVKTIDLIQNFYHQPVLPLMVEVLDQVDGLDRQQRLAAAGWNF